MVKNFVNSIAWQNLVYNLMAVMFVLVIISVIVLKVAIEMDEVYLAIAFSAVVIGVFVHQYNS